MTVRTPTPRQMECLKVVWQLAGRSVANHECQELAPFCDDASTLTKPDVFNQCHDLGWLISGHNGLSDCSYVKLTEEGLLACGHGECGTPNEEKP